MMTIYGHVRELEHLCVSKNITGLAPTSPSNGAHPMYRHQWTCLKQAGYQPDVLSDHPTRSAHPGDPMYRHGLRM